MLVRTTNGFHPVLNLRSEMDRMVRNYFGPAVARAASVAAGFPPLNVWEEGDTLYAEAEVPGVKSEDIDVSVVGSDLILHGQRQSDQSEGTSYHRQERGFGEFNRVLRLPAEVDANRVEAQLTDGVLTITLPKAESAKPRKIQVNASK